MTEFHATRNIEKGGTLHAGENKREREREREDKERKVQGSHLDPLMTYSSERQ